MFGTNDGITLRMANGQINGFRRKIQDFVKEKLSSGGLTLNALTQELDKRTADLKLGFGLDDKVIRRLNTDIDWDIGQYVSADQLNREMKVYFEPANDIDYIRDGNEYCSFDRAVEVLSRSRNKEVVVPKKLSCSEYLLRQALDGILPLFKKVKNFIPENLDVENANKYLMFSVADIKKLAKEAWDKPIAGDDCLDTPDLLLNIDSEPRKTIENFSFGKVVRMLDASRNRGSIVPEGVSTAEYLVNLVDEGSIRAFRAEEGDDAFPAIKFRAHDIQALNQYKWN